MQNILMMLGAVALFMVIAVLFNLCRLLWLVVCDMEASKRKDEQVIEVEEEFEDDFFNDDEYSDLNEKEAAIDDLAELPDCDSDELPFSEIPSFNHSNVVSSRREEI